MGENGNGGLLMVLTRTTSSVGHLSALQHSLPEVTSMEILTFSCTEIWMLPLSRSSIVKTILSLNQIVQRIERGMYKEFTNVGPWLTNNSK